MAHAGGLGADPCCPARLESPALFIMRGVRTPGLACGSAGRFEAPMLQQLLPSRRGARLWWLPAALGERPVMSSARSDPAAAAPRLPVEA